MVVNQSKPFHAKSLRDSKMWLTLPGHSGNLTPGTKTRLREMSFTPPLRQ